MAVQELSPIQPLNAAQRPVALCLMGPTGSGKTALALALHERLPVEIISVDAAQVYRGLDIGTAKPSHAEQARARHRLIDIRDPSETYSAAEFRADALREMAEISAGGRVPLLVGGTMFYFRALEYGLSKLPAANPAVRARLKAAADNEGWGALHARLTRLDPVAARRIAVSDSQRLLRALEIIEITGETPTRLAGTTPPAPAPYDFVKLAIFPRDRALLHERINDRFLTMISAGLIAEVEALRGRGDLHSDLPSLRTVGYRQVWQYLSGVVGYRDMVNQAQAATRQLAKRQYTWLRRYPDVVTVDMSVSPPVRECLELLGQSPVLAGLKGL